MARQKIKKFSEKLTFFLEFSQYFSNFLLILRHIFEKLPQILGLCPIVKFRSTLEKSDPPPNILWTHLNRKILHKLLNICISKANWSKHLGHPNLETSSTFQRNYEPIFGRNIKEDLNITKKFTFSKKISIGKKKIPKRIFYFSKVFCTIVLHSFENLS